MRRGIAISTETCDPRPMRQANPCPAACFGSIPAPRGVRLVPGQDFVSCTTGDAFTVRGGDVVGDPWIRTGPDQERDGKPLCLSSSAIVPTVSRCLRRPAPTPLQAEREPGNPFH